MIKVMLNHAEDKKQFPVMVSIDNVLVRQKFTLAAAKELRDKLDDCMNSDSLAKCCAEENRIEGRKVYRLLEDLLEGGE